MAKVTTNSPDKPDDDASVSVLRQSDTQKSDMHVEQLLAIAEHCSKWLWTRAEIGETVDVDPTLKNESRKTAELVHLRLRGLIDEERRWTLDPTLHEKESSKLIDSTVELYNQKTVNAKIHNRPSIFLRPKIGRFEQGWIAWIGGELPLRRDLHGVGISPALAMQAFDEHYYAIEEIADAQPAVVVPPPAKKPAPKRPTKKT